MSFRRRNVVLSTAPASDTAPKPQQPDAQNPVTAVQQPPRPPRLPKPTWVPAPRPQLTPAERAQIEPAKRRLRAFLDRAKQTRQQQYRQQKKARQLGGAAAASPLAQAPPLGPGTRPSPFDGRPITSTGTASLDPLLAGYGGLVLGHSLLVEEQGTTDFASVLLRAYAAEGLVQGHHVHVLGVGPGWRTELPGLASPASSSGRQANDASDAPAGKMKIAWRYEALAARPAPSPQLRSTAPGAVPAAPSSSSPAPTTFCHAFDLTKRLAAADIRGTLHASPLPSPLRPSPAPEHAHSPLRAFLRSVRASLDATPASAIHRVVLPSFLAPTLYAMDGWSFSYILRLLHGLRSLLRMHARRLTVAISLSTSLYGRRTNPYVWHLEQLCDNIVELVPLPPGPPSAAAPGGTTGNNISSPSADRPDKADKMQGWFKVHKLQIYSEIGGAGASSQGHALRENLCFSVSSSRGLVIMPYSLPPVDDDSHKEKSPASTVKDGLEF